jgi:Flp pilus assembly protein TadG
VKRPISGLLRNQRGQALVEFAFTSIIFFMTIFGIIEFGLAVWQYNMVANLSKEGARWASVRGSSSGAQQATVAQVQSYVQTRALGLNVTVTTTAAPGCTTSTDPSSLHVGDLVCVKVEKNFTPLTGLIPNTTLLLQSTSQMVMAR